MKALLKDPFAAGAAVLTAVAFAGSFTHTRETVAQYGQTGWMATATALMPEGMVALGVLKIRRGGDRRELTWAWTVLVVAVAFTVWANLEQAAPGVRGWVVGGFPALAAIGAAGMLKLRPTGEQARARKAAPRAGTPSTSRGVAVSSTASGTPTTPAPSAAPNGLRAVPDRSESSPDPEVARAFLVAHPTRDDGRAWGRASLAAAAGVTSNAARKALEGVNAA